MVLLRFLSCSLFVFICFNRPLVVCFGCIFLFDTRLVCCPVHARVSSRLPVVFRGSTVRIHCISVLLLFLFSPFSSFYLLTFLSLFYSVSWFPFFLVFLFVVFLCFGFSLYSVLLLFLFLFVFSLSVCRFCDLVWLRYVNWLYPVPFCGFSVCYDVARCVRLANLYIVVASCGFVFFLFFRLCLFVVSRLVLFVCFFPLIYGMVCSGICFSLFDCSPS